MDCITLPQFQFDEVTKRWFDHINRSPFTGSLVERRRYIHIKVENDERLGRLNEIDLGDVTLYEPPRPVKGLLDVILDLRDGGVPSEAIPLGITFAQAMEGKPWCEDWRGVNYVACFGSIAKFSKHHAMSCPRLIRDRTTDTVKIAWAATSVFRKTERLALYRPPT